MVHSMVHWYGDILQYEEEEEKEAKICSRHVIRNSTMFEYNLQGNHNSTTVDSRVSQVIGTETTSDTETLG